MAPIMEQCVMSVPTAQKLAPWRQPARRPAAHRAPSRQPAGRPAARRAPSRQPAGRRSGAARRAGHLQTRTDCRCPGAHLSPMRTQFVRGGPKESSRQPLGALAAWGPARKRLWAICRCALVGGHATLFTGPIPLSFSLQIWPVTHTGSDSKAADARALVPPVVKGVCAGHAVLKGVGASCITSQPSPRPTLAQGPGPITQIKHAGSSAHLLGIVRGSGRSR